jgi:hypothetical protein
MHNHQEPSTFTEFTASGTVCRCSGCVFLLCSFTTVVKEHSRNTQPEQRHTVPEAVNAVRGEGS